MTWVAFAPDSSNYVNTNQNMREHKPFRRSEKPTVNAVPDTVIARWYTSFLLSDGIILTAIWRC
jgi:hypothetical protein